MAWTKEMATKRTDTFMFRELTDQEEEEFRTYARAHVQEVLDKWDIVHPVCRDEVTQVVREREDALAKGG